MKMDTFDKIYEDLVGAHIDEIRNEVVNAIVDRLFTEFKKEAEFLVRSEAEKIVSSKIEAWRDIYDRKDHLKISFEWENK